MVAELYSLSMRSLGILFVVYDITLSTLGEPIQRLEMGRRYNNGNRHDVL